ncbi:MAG TPA: alpha-2-macroglobulin family protein [Terriglobia bacterium]|nr:alpha-2-macroglobulin family protein [Terriglobia bacterium]
MNLDRARRTSRRQSEIRLLWAAISLLALFLVPQALRGQDAEATEPFFSVSSRQTYAPSQQPKVWIEFRQVDRLDFRIYRVKDPEQFFAKLKEAHSFGSEKRELAREKTLLEIFHAWKRDLRLSIRDFFRRQLRFETRSHYRGSQTQEQKLQRIPLDVTAYAQIPLLNREQLVIAWRELLPRTRDSEYREIPVDLHQRGLFLVEVAHRELRAYTLLMITDLALVSKTAPGQILLYAAHRASGEPVAGAKAVIYNNHQELARGTTDSSGVFQTTFKDIRVENAVMLVESELDFAATSVESFFFYDSSATEYMGYIYSDRPVYRPTHEVNFKGILRARRAGRYSLDVPGPVSVEVTDSTSKTIYEQKLDLSPFGSFHGKLVLGPLAALGMYSIVAHVGEHSIYGSFEVQEYKKPEFEVTVSTDKARYLQGETMEATISAHYYFGPPVANGQVKYSVYKSRYYFPYWRVLWGTDEFEGDEGDYENYYYNTYGQEITQASGKLDTDGVLKIRVPTAVDSEGRDYRYRIEAHVTDASNREIVGGRSALVTFSSIVVLVDTNSYVYKPGDRADIMIRTVDYDFQPVSARVLLFFETTENRTWAWRSNAVRKLLGQVEVQTDARGVGHHAYTIPQVPWLMVRANALDPRGRPATHETSVWISGVESEGGEAEFRRPEIYLDKHFYKPGDVAQVLIVTHEPGADVLLTTEGQQVYTWSRHKVEGTSVTVGVLIEERYEPNFFIGVTFVKNEQLFEASKNVSVPATEKVLNVTIETDKAQYRPNDQVTYTIRTEDAGGRPVSAEVSLGVVDEAIYAVRPESVRPPEKVFYARSWNKVYTQFSTTYWFMGYSGRHKMQLTSLRSPTQLADFKSGQTVQPKVRKYFPDTTYWAPSVVTDSSGRARASFAFPDSLTTWRATARAVSRDTLVGQVTHQVITRKNLILRLEIPRFLTQGDTVTVTGIVHNYLEREKSVRVSLQAEGVELASDAQADVNIAKNGEAVVNWTVRAPRIGEAKFLGKALTDEESDALELTMPVEPWGLQLNSALSGSLTGDKAEVTQKITIPAGINPDATTLRIDLAPSVAGTLMSALDYLARYPYGCVEQTMSSFLPNILVTQAVKELGLTPPPASTDLEKKIAAGLQRLYQFQHDDGGWGWWETDETHPFMTAYVVAGLAQARDAGYPVTEYRLRRGRDSLLKQINENPRALADIRAYLVYALALSGDFDRKLADDLYDSREKLSPYGTALMALLFARLNDPRAQELVKSLEQSVQLQGPYASWKSERQEMLDFSSDNSFEATAHAVKALSRLDPKSELLPKAARWLIDRRSSGYYWTSTEQTAMSIYGLIDYLKVSGELKPDYTLNVFVNGKKVAEQRMTQEQVANPLPLVVTVKGTDVPAGANEIRLEKNGPGVLYWSAFASYFTREPRPAPEGGIALNVVREYFKLVPERLENRIVYSEQPFNGAVQSGDVLAVRLTVTSTQDESYLQIEDPIPAGFEFIEQEDLYELKRRPDWWSYYYTRREFHDDRVAMFSTRFRKGQARFHYLLKAISPGTFQANPARVLPMYEPSRQASTRSLGATVNPR